jgi:uncharacterized protein with PhoU and TrkA domain
MSIQDCCTFAAANANLLFKALNIQHRLTLIEQRVLVLEERLKVAKLISLREITTVNQTFCIVALHQHQNAKAISLGTRINLEHLRL